MNRSRFAPSRAAFTLIELLVVIAIIAVLVGILLPVLAHARESGRAAGCLSNHRQNFLLLRAYADDHKGYGPALGEPYAALPNWALVIQASSGRLGSGPADLYTTGSSLVCASASGRYGPEMTRTYAINATGLAGAPGDRANFDAPLPAPPATVRFDLVPEPSRTPALVDSAPATPGPGQPPPTRTASVLDLRNADHVAGRLGRVHPIGVGFQAAMYDGSASPHREIAPHWLTPLP